MVQPTGGQSREGVGSVLVTPGGQVVGTAGVTQKERTRGRGGTSRRRAQEAAARKAEQEKQQLILEEKRKEQAIIDEEQRRKQTIVRTAVVSERKDIIKKRDIVGPKPEPIIIKRVVGTAGVDSQGRIIPQVEVVVGTPGKQGGGFRPAIEEETSLVQENNQVIVGTNEPKSNIRNIKNDFLTTTNKLNQNLKESITTPITKGVSLINVKTGLPTSFEEARLKASKQPKPIAFLSGAAIGQLEDIKEKPLKQVALLGAGAVLGAGLRVGTFTAGRIGLKIGAALGTRRAGAGNITPVLIGSLKSDVTPKGLKKIIRTQKKSVQFTSNTGLALKGQLIGQRTVQLSALVAGVGLTGVAIAQTGQQVKGKDPVTAGGIIGVTAKDFSLVGAGAVKGDIIGRNIVGGIRSIGTKNVPIELITDPATEAGLTKFPRFKKGETVHQARQRFFEPKLPGETRGTPRGFTATDVELLAKGRNISPGKIIEIDPKLPGSKTDVLTGKQLAPGTKTLKSEFPGRYAADVTSTAFLKGKGESRSVGLLDALGGEPTIIRQTLKGIEIPKTSGGRLTKSTARVKELELKLGGRRGLTPEEIGQRTPTLEGGKGIVPFIKNEREIIIATTGKQVNIRKNFSTKVGSVRVPIFQSEIIGSESTGLKGVSGQKELLGRGQAIKGAVLESEISSVTASRPSAIITPSRIGTGLSLSSTTSHGLTKSFGSTIKGSSIRGSRTSVRGSSSKSLTSSIRGSSISSRPSRITSSLSSLSSSLSSSSSSLSSSKSSSSSITSAVSKKKKRLLIPTLGGRAKKAGVSSLLTVQVRRGGKFRTVGTAKTPSQAISILTQRVGGTLAATGRIRGLTPGQQIATPTGFRRKGTTTFIEKKSFRLSKTPEIKEIQTARRRSKR